jgi:hypothetical protein
MCNADRSKKTRWPIPAPLPLCTKYRGQVAGSTADSQWLSDGNRNRQGMAVRNSQLPPEKLGIVAKWHQVCRPEGPGPSGACFISGRIKNRS